MWASSWLGDSACFHIDTSDRERRERATRWNSNVETFHRRVIVPSFVPSFAYLLLSRLAKTSTLDDPTTLLSVVWTKDDLSFLPGIFIKYLFFFLL